MSDETLSWIDADGDETQLDGSDGATVLTAVAGRFMPPFQMVEDEIPFQPGARLRRVKTKVREVVLPMIFRGVDEADLREVMRAWAVRFSPDRGPGVLRATGPVIGTDIAELFLDEAPVITDPLVETRDLNCIYTGGLEAVEDLRGTKGLTWQKVVAVFRAHDPYWYDADDTTALFELPPAVPFFPFFPLTLSSSEVVATVTLTNDGDVEAWPVWTITGPCAEGFKLRNVTTGDVTTVEAEIFDGQTVEIDTRPGYKTVTRYDGANLFGYLSDDSSLWPLAVGDNEIRVEVTEASHDTNAVIAYKRRFYTP